MFLLTLCNMCTQQIIWGCSGDVMLLGVRWTWDKVQVDLITSTETNMLVVTSQLSAV